MRVSPSGLTLGLLGVGLSLLLAVQTARADILYTGWGSTIGTIERFNTGGTGSVFVMGSHTIQPTDMEFPNGLAFDLAGNLYSARWDNNTIQKVAPAGTISVIPASVIATQPNGEKYSQQFLNIPTGIAFDNAGNLYAANIGSNTITKVAPDGTPSIFASAGVISPEGLAFDRAGNLYVAYGTANTIEKFTPSGAASVFASTGMAFPRGLAFDSAGNLYVANARNNTIERFTPGGVGSLFANTDLDNPGGLAFDSTGDLYVANTGSTSAPNSAYETIARFTPDGVGSIFASGLPNHPMYLAFTNDAGVPLSLPAPEPGSGALFVLGVFALLQRRTRMI